ncbi:MAG: hypothetical protein ABIN00_04670 [candidate division WOR-3 bacterium]
MTKKIIIIFLLISLLTPSLFAAPVFSIQKQNGGIVPCLLGIFDMRMGYLANEKAVNVDLLEVLQLVFPILRVYYAFVGFQNAGVEGCCIGYVGGYTTAQMMKETKGRLIEWLTYVPVANIYSMIVYITETMGGKKWSEVVAKENLKRK